MPMPPRTRRRPSAPAIGALLLTLALAACERAADASEPSAPPELEAALERSDDPVVQAARAALADGRPFRATQILAPRLRDTTAVTPEVTLLAARAAAAWDGWATVQSLLAGRSWLDARFDGDGRELLARAALERGADSLAAAHAAAAVRAAPDDGARGRRLALLARAHDRRDELAPAAEAYREAADLLPRSAAWLRLRAAGVTADGAARARLLASVDDSLARTQLRLVEARARERLGDAPGASTAFAAAGEPALALRAQVRWADSTGRDALLPDLRASLARLVADRAGTADARTAAETLREHFAPLTAAEELAVARTLARTGPSADAVRAYEAAARQAPASITADDRLRWADALSRLGRDAAAAAQYARVPDSHARASDAAYLRARAVLRAGRGGEARTLLRAIPGRFPKSEGAARALYLLADLATDEGRDGPARATFRAIGRDHPAASLASRARFQAAIIAIAQGDHRAAAAELDTLADRHPTGDEAIGALYWAGRSYARLGDTTRARQRWRAALERAPLTYYGVLAARRLDAAWWTPAPAPATAPRLADLDAALARVDELRALGLDPEAEREIARIAAQAAASPERRLATAEAFQARGLSSRGIQLGLAALRAGAAPDARTYRTIYPIVHRDVLAAEASEHGLDPALVAALIRQESNFQANARSGADARGLMQLLPSVGRSIARARDFPVWEDALLYQPDVNVQLGTAHLAALERQYDALPHVLAAYNAGGSRVTRWRRKGGAEGDPELFAERIPYDETRDYVRIVERNRAIYDALYEFGR
jgi:soluble lytic murein transglycosylase